MKTPMKCLRLTITGILLFFTTDKVAAQELPKFIPPSPVTAALFKTLDYPVDYSTGLTSINIPLYEIKSGPLTVPISISYHASGRKVYDENGQIGLGWTLNAGGMISRVIYGSADEDILYPFQYIAQSSLNQGNTSDFDYLAGVEKFSKAAPTLYKDSEYDIFSYILNGTSGKFVLKDNAGVKTPALIPHRQYNITWTKTTDNRKINTFSVVDDKGTTYNFIAGEVSPYGTSYGYTSWLLSSIVAVNKTDTVSFSYNSVVRQRTTYSMEYTLTDNWMGLDCESYPSPEFSDVDQTASEQYTIYTLSQITFRGGKVLFTADTDPAFAIAERYMIKNIQVFDKSDQLLRTIQFNRSKQDYVLNNANLYKINSLFIKDKTGADIEKYLFEYFPTVFTSSYPTSIHPKYRDYWGYYNASNQFHMVPEWTNIQFVHKNAVNISNVSVGHPAAVREPNIDAVKSGVLKKITYPTGGSSEFVYELNQYKDPVTQQTKKGPGIRVSQIISNDANGRINYRSFKYGTNENGLGLCQITPRVEFMSYQRTHYYNNNGGWSPMCGLTYRKRFYTSDFIPDLSFLASQPVSYAEVAEYSGTIANNTGKTVYSYELFVSTTPSTLISNTGIPKYHVSKFNYWNDNSLVKQTVFKREMAGSVVSYIPVSTKDIIYQATELEQIYGLRVRRNLANFQSGETYPVAPNQWPAPGGYPDRYVATYVTPTNLVYAYGNYTVSIGYKNLSKVTETKYTDENTSITTETNYLYNSRNLLSSTDRKASNGDVLAETTKYPFDLISDPLLGTISTNMMNLNMVHYPVEQVSQKNGVQLNSTRTTYFNWGTTATPLIAPQTIDAKKGSGAYITRLRFHSYDSRGNVTSVSKENDVQHVYIWGYEGLYPVAEIVGTSYANANGVLNQTIVQSQTTTDQVMRTELDKIRINFPAAQVTTYTYQPLIGMTSLTDVNKKTQYYEYDSFNRLKLIRDVNSNILKTFKYGFQATSPY